MIPNSIFTVYKLLNKNTGRAYYGRTKNPHGRQYYHIRACERGEHYNLQMNADHETDCWEFIAIKDGLTQRAANQLSDELAKGDGTCYNLLGVTPSNKGGPKRKLMQADVDTIRDLYYAGEFNQVELSQQFGVTQGLISLTVNGLVHNRGDFSPPDRKPDGYDTRSRGKHQRFELRARMAELTKGRMTKKTAIKKLTEEFDLHEDTVTFWLYNEPSKCFRDMFVGANLTHAPSTKRVLIDDMPFHSIVQWSQQTGRKVKETIWMAPRVYITRENRTVLVDGVEYKIGKKTPIPALRELGVHPVKKVSSGVYSMLDTPKEIRERQYEQLARDALKDPVRARMTGRVLVAATVRKHGLNRPVADIMSRLVAEPAGS